MKNSIFVIILSFGFLLNSCSQEPVSLSLVQTELPHINFQGFKIPKFPTALGQLNYAKSGFVDSKEKKAALEIISFLFPESRVQCGHAALNLAYMKLGYDYRFANQYDFHNAIISYHKVIQNYKKYPQILVNANWYLGWIHCDLLNSKNTGVEYFWHIVKTWPEIKMGISSPVPWVSLVYPSKEKSDQSLNNKANVYWAGISLLEIIRHTEKKEESLKAFDLLWEKYNKTILTGLALNLMLEKNELKAKIVPFVKPYLELNVANKYLARQIYNHTKEK